MDLSKLITLDDVSNFLVENGIPQEFTVVLKDNYIDGLEFRELEYQDLLHILPGKLGIVKKIWRLLKHYYDQIGIGIPLAKKDNVVDAVLHVIKSRREITDSQSPARDIVSTSKDNITSPLRNDSSDKEPYGELSPMSSENIPKTPVSDSSFVEVSINDQLQSSQIEDLEFNSKRIPSLPVFSPRIQMALNSGKIAQDYDKFVEEAAYDLISKGDIINDRGLYEHYSRKMFKQYPCIGFPGGKKEWSCFSKKLSGKLRNIRWRRQKNKRNHSFISKKRSLNKKSRIEKKLKLDGYVVNEIEPGEPFYEEHSANWLEDVVYVPIKQEAPDREEFPFGRGELDVSLQDLDTEPEEGNIDSQSEELAEFMNKIISQSTESKHSSADSKDSSSFDCQETTKPNANEATSLSQETNKVSVTYGEITKRAIIDRECIKSTVEIIKKKFQFHPTDKIRIEAKIDDVEDYITLNPDDDEDLQELKKCTKLRIKKIMKADLCDVALPKSYLHIDTVNHQQEDVNSCPSKTIKKVHILSDEEKGYIQDRIKTVREDIVPLSQCTKLSLILKNITSVPSNADARFLLPEEEFRKFLNICNNASIEEKMVILDLMKKIRYNRWFWLHEKTPSITEVLQVFPRFVDIDEMINIDFTEMYGLETSNKLFIKWEDVIAPAILQLAKQTKSSSALTAILEELPVNHTKEMVSMFAFIWTATLLLSHSAKKNQRCSSLEANFFIEFQKNKSFVDLIKFVNNRTQTQPFLLCIGSIYEPDQMFLIAETSVISCHNNVVRAVDKLFKCHFSFNVEYASSISHFYQFLEYFVYEMNLSSSDLENNFSSTVSELVSSLDCIIPKQSFTN